jgi:hypothetical protein
MLQKSTGSTFGQLKYFNSLKDAVLLGKIMIQRPAKENNRD